MSVSLEFWSVSWNDLAAAIGSRNRRLHRAALQKSEARFEEDVDRGLERWILGQVPPTVTDEDDAAGFLALVAQLGMQVGGAKYRRDFLKASEARFGPLGFLMDRPIAGYRRREVPAWGGLSKAELAALPLPPDAPTDPDPDIDAWLLHLWNALGSAKDAGRDLVTVYG